MKLLVLIREDLGLAKNEISDLQIFHVFKHNQRSVEKSLDLVNKIHSWKKEHRQLLENSARFDVGEFQRQMFQQNIQFGFYGMSKQGWPLRYLILNSDILSTLKTDLAQFELFFHQYYERLYRVVFESIKRQTGKYPEGLISVICFEKVSLKEVILDFELQSILVEKLRLF